MRNGLAIVALLSSLFAGPARAEPKVGDEIEVMAGTPFFWPEYDDSIRGTITVTAKWTVRDLDGGWLAVERTDGGVTSKVALDPDRLRGQPSGPATTTKTVATAAECARGSCNFGLHAGKRLNEHFPDMPHFVHASADTTFHRPIRVCKLGPLYRFDVGASAGDWLAPAVIAPKVPLGYFFEHEDTVTISAEGQPATPPSCPVIRAFRRIRSSAATPRRAAPEE
jgi:hypothetical protein